MAATPRHDPGAASRPMNDEADIGSGEKTPAQIETEKLIGEIPPLPPARPPAPRAGQGEGKPPP